MSPNLTSLCPRGRTNVRRASLTHPTILMRHADYGNEIWAFSLRITGVANDGLQDSNLRMTLTRNG